MQPEDKPAVLALWQSQRNESEEFAKKAIEQFAGEQNVYVAEDVYKRQVYAWWRKRLALWAFALAFLSLLAVVGLACRQVCLLYTSFWACTASITSRAVMFRAAIFSGFSQMRMA